MTGRSMFCNSKELLFSVFYVFVLSFFSIAQNPVVTENALPGNPISEWGVPDFRDNRIAGFSTKMSLNRGETVRFKISVQGAANYTLKIYRIGYYGGNGARLKQDLGTLSGTIQPAGISNPTTGLLDCSNWSESAAWTIPSTAVSGFYIAKLERSGGGSNHIAFIVRNDASNSDLYLQFPDATWQAYNGYGGNSMYDGSTGFPGGHAVKVSYNRPFFPYNSLFNTDGREADWYMNAEYPMIRWLERNGYDVTYTSCNDVDNNGSRLLNHKVFISLGHDEYWSKKQRENVEAARNAGVHLAFFSGNEVYWKTRWESNNGSEDRTLVCYKEGLLGNGTQGERTCGSKCDGSSTEWTGLWRTGGNYDAGKPENALVGQISWVEFPTEIGVPSYYKKLRFWRNTSIPNLSAGQTASLGINTLGYEWDYEQPQYAGHCSSGRITMSSKTVNGLTHKLSLYRHSSGALVFGAGTVQWSWGLDGQHWGGSTVVSPEMQQATVNLFADMGVQPGTLQNGLSNASQSTDFTAPNATITTPLNGASFPTGSTITISGTAADGGGGVVAGVEVSVDGGNTWRIATVSDLDGTVTWSYSWVSSNGTFNIKSRGFDDSGNKGNGGTGININVGPPDLNPPTVSSVSPVTGATGVSSGTTITANFNEPISGSTVTGTTFQLRDAANNLVSATVSTSSNQITLIPSSALVNSTSYTVMIIGGATGVKDLAGNALVNNYSWSFTTAGVTGGCPCTIFQPGNTPQTQRDNDGQGIVVGMKFRATQNGIITGIRYYKGAGTTGNHTGHLWSNTGMQLASAAFTGETSSGWQQVLFSSPVAITAGVTYVASYFSSSGDYASSTSYFTQAVVNGPLRALANGEDGPNGLYRYATASAFPNSSFQSSNYWVDVLFNTTDITMPTVSSVSPVNGATGISVTSTVTANFSEAINVSTITGSTFQLKDAANNLVSANLSTSSNQVTLITSSAFANSTTYTVTIKGGSSGVKDLAGNALANDYNWSFTTGGGSSGCPCTIFQPGNTPQIPLNNDGQGIIVGMKFRSTQNGTVTGIRYYKGAGTTGIHTGHLWSNTGVQLASVTFTGETGSGWQQALFSSQVPITAGITYVVSCFSPSGDYAATKPYFTQAVVNGPIRGLADGEDGPNGLYRYSATSVFPDNSFQSSNYWVDVVFATGGTAVPTVTTHPSPQTVCAGTNVSFTSAATGDTPNIQWQSNNDGATWMNISGATNSTLTFVTTAGDNNRQYRAVWTNSGGSVNSNPVTLSVNSVPGAPEVSVVNNCGNSVLTAGSFTGTLLWSNGATNSAITVTTAGTYTVTQTLNGCTSAAAGGAASPLTSSVAAPTLSVINNCGNSALTALGFTGSLLWSTGATASSITVTTAGIYTVTQTVSGCTGPAASVTAAPKAIPVFSGSLTATFNSSTPFVYIPSATVAGTVFSWSRSVVAGISNTAATGSGNIAETLVNTTSSPVNVTYIYTMTANGCINTQNVVITVNPAPTVNCVINSSITSSFSSTSIKAGRYIWFNSSFDPGDLGTGTTPVTINISNSRISFTANSVQYILNVPNSRIRFDASVTSASTQFINNVWETVVPRNFDSYIFMSGLSYLVPVNFPGNIRNVVWTANISINKTGVSIVRRWSAAVYTNFAGNAGVNVKPVSGNAQNPYPNSDKAGTPENLKASLVSGAMGSGGTNYTGTFITANSATCTVTGQRSSVQPAITSQTITRQLPDLPVEKLVRGKLEAQVIPNPSSTFFNLAIQGTQVNPVTVRVIDIFGQVIEQHDKIASSTNLRLGHKWKSGSYFAELIQGDQRKIVKMIKVN